MKFKVRKNLKITTMCLFALNLLILQSPLLGLCYKLSINPKIERSFEVTVKAFTWANSPCDISQSVFTFKTVLSPLPDENEQIYCNLHTLKHCKITPGTQYYLGEIVIKDPKSKKIWRKHYSFNSPGQSTSADAYGILFISIAPTSETDFFQVTVQGDNKENSTTFERVGPF